jgi:hypothetical protein
VDMVIVVAGIRTDLSELLWIQDNSSMEGHRHLLPLIAPTMAHHIQPHHIITEALGMVHKVITGVSFSASKFAITY